MGDWARLEEEITCDLFEISTSLLGQEHWLMVDGVQCFVRMPPKGHSKQASSLASYKADDPLNEEYQSHAVFRCRVGMRFRLKEYGLSVSDLAEVTDVRTTASLRTASWEIMPKVFDRWLRTLFWVSRQTPLAAQDRSSRRDPYAFILEKDERRLPDLGGLITLGPRAKIDQAAWKHAASAFHDGVDVPLWINYLFDAFRLAFRREFKSSVISAAVACETVIRAYFWQLAGEIKHPIASGIIDDVAIQKILGRWSDLTSLTKAELAAIHKSRVHDLFGYRNEIAHRGKAPDLTPEGFHKLLGEIQVFIIDTERRLANEKAQRSYTL